jgi:hypothetical protein
MMFWANTNGHKCSHQVVITDDLGHKVGIAAAVPWIQEWIEHRAGLKCCHVNDEALRAKGLDPHRNSSDPCEHHNWGWTLDENHGIWFVFRDRTLGQEFANEFTDPQTIHHFEDMDPDLIPEIVKWFKASGFKPNNSKKHILVQPKHFRIVDRPMSKTRYIKTGFEIHLHSDNASMLTMFKLRWGGDDPTA